MSKQNLLKKLNSAKLYCFTPDKFADGRDIIDIINQQIEGGCNIIQLREKKISERNKLLLAKKIRAITLKKNILFMVNDDIDIAYFSNADGVHLGQDDIPYTYAKELLKGKLIGVSTHNIEQYKKAQEFDVDYTAIGPIFPTRSKDIPDPAVGIDKLQDILKYKKKLTVAIGGIKLSNLDYFKNINIDIFAIITDIILANDIKKQTTFIKNKLISLNNEAV